ncbi:hypothetical protein [Nissabacter sp. SGAir0207]
MCCKSFSSQKQWITHLPNL